MNVACPGCQTRYSVDDGRIPPSGVTIECPKCKTSFAVKKEDASVPLPGARSSAVALPGSRASSAVALPGNRSAAPRTAPDDDLDLGLNLDDLASSPSMRSPTSAPAPRSAPPKASPKGSSPSFGDSGMLDFIDDTAAKAKTRAPGPTGSSELRLRRRTGQTEGPFAPARIIAMLRGGDFDGTEEISDDGRSWRPMSSHPDLAHALQEVSRSRGAASDLEFEDLPGPAGPRDLPGLADPMRNLPGLAGPRDLPGLADPMRNLPNTADPMRNLPNTADPMRNLPADSPRNAAGAGGRAGGPALNPDDELPDLELDGPPRGRNAPTPGGAKITGMTAEQAAELRRQSTSAPAPGGGIDPSMLELGDVPKPPSVWESYKKLIIGFGAVVGVILVGVVTELFTPAGAFGYKAVARLFEPPPPPSPPPPPPPPVQVVRLDEAQRLITAASFEGLREILAALDNAAKDTDNTLLKAKAHALATVLHGPEAFPVTGLEAAFSAAAGVDLAGAKSISVAQAGLELLKAQTGLLIAQGQFDQAAGKLEPALQSNQDDREIALLLGVAETRANNIEAALKALDRATVIDSAYAPALVAIGDAVSAVKSDVPGAGGPSVAVEWYEKAARAEPTYTAGALKAAAAFSQLGRPGDARRMLGVAAENAARGIAPAKRAETLYQAARAYDDFELLARAASFAEEAARLEPANAAYVALGARALTARGEAKAGYALAETGLKHAATDAGLLLARAEAAMADTDVTRAFQDAAAAKRAQPKAWEPLYAEGRFNLQLSKLNDARDALIVAIRQAGDASVMPTIMLGRLELDVGNIDAAYEYATNSVKSQPNHAGARILLGDAERRRGELAEARKTFERALELDPESGRARLGLANVLRDLATRTEAPARSPELAEALPLYVDALLGDPKDASLMFEYGRALELLGQRSSALDLYRDAIAINESDARPHIALAAAYVEADPPDLAAAKAALAQADKINPLDTGTAFWKARVAMLEGRRDDAQKSMDVALRGEPNNAEYHYWSGRLYESFDSLFEAIKEYEKAVSLNSRHARAYRALGIAATARNQFEKARGHFEKYRAAAPHDQTVWVDIGLSYVRENRDPEALKIFEEVIARDPDQALVLVEIGAIIARRGDDAGALTYYKRAAKADPTFGDGWCQYGIVAALDSPSKPSKEAVAALTKCVELDNSSSDLKKTAQQALAQAGR